ncbi:MerR family transcriptional regulator [Corynebacterium sp. 335C]
MRIGELADRSGATPRQLRYYEEKGLIASRRSANGYRDYDDADVEKVRQIRCLLDGGFTTELVARLLPRVHGPHADLPPQEDPEMEAELRAHMDRLRERIDMLSRFHDRYECYLRRVDGSGGPYDC